MEFGLDMKKTLMACCPPKAQINLTKRLNIIPKAFRAAQMLWGMNPNIKRWHYEDSAPFFFPARSRDITDICPQVWDVKHITKRGLDRLLRGSKVPTPFWTPVGGKGKSIIRLVGPPPGLMTFRRQPIEPDIPETRLR
jgi:hypothetical protein